MHERWHQQMPPHSDGMVVTSLIDGKFGSVQFDARRLHLPYSTHNIYDSLDHLYSFVHNIAPSISYQFGSH